MSIQAAWRVPFTFWGNAAELRTAAGLAAGLQGRTPRGVVQAPTAAVEPAEPGQLAEAERGYQEALAQEHPPHVVTP